MTDLWSERAEAFRESEVHRQGADLDLLVEWAEGETALDVAAGGGHTARRLREAGFEATTLDPAPGMHADVLAPAEHIPFADGAFDTVCCRIAAHHFDDAGAAVAEMARVARRAVLVDDLLFDGEEAEEAHKIRDPSHVRSYSKAEWREMFNAAGLEVASVKLFETRAIPYQPWLERTACVGKEAERVTALLGLRVAEGRVDMPLILIKGRKR